MMFFFNKGRFVSRKHNQGDMSNLQYRPHNNIFVVGPFHSNSSVMWFHSLLRTHCALLRLKQLWILCCLFFKLWWLLKEIFSWELVDMTVMRRHGDVRQKKEINSRYFRDNTENKWGWSGLFVAMNNLCSLVFPLKIWNFSPCGWQWRRLYI